MAEPAIRCKWCGEVIEQDDGGSWAGPWFGYEDGEDLTGGVEARQYCLKSPDRKHGFGIGTARETTEEIDG